MYTRMNEEYKEFRNKLIKTIRKNQKYKYTSIYNLNRYIKRKWIKEKANQEYDKYIIENSKEFKVKFNDNIEIREFTKD